MTALTHLDSRFVRQLALRRQPPFDRLTDSEVSLVAEAAEPRLHPPGTLVHASECSVSHLLIVVRGTLVTPEGQPVGPLPGLGAMLAGRTLTELRAGPDGCDLLLLSKNFLHTLIRECPAFAEGLVTLPLEGGSA